MLILVCVAVSGFGQNLHIDRANSKPPETSDPTFDGYLKTAFDTLMGKIDKEIETINARPEKLIRGFADASVFASQGATQRAYGGYKIFAFTLGAMAGLRMPEDPFSIAKDPQIIADKMKQEGDINAGVSAQVLNAQLGINASFLLKDLHLALRFGYFDLKAVEDTGIEDVSFKTMNVGALASYPILGGKDMFFLKWRGVTATSGFIFQNTKVGYNYKIEEQKVLISGGPAVLIADPRLVFDMNVNTYVVPLEINTSILLLRFINLNVGFGADLAFGENKTVVKLDSTFDVEGAPVSITEKGYLSIEGGGSMAPSFFNPKIMFDLGFKLGPVILDVPVTYYFTNGNGLSVGITFGVVW